MLVEMEGTSAVPICKAVAVAVQQAQVEALIQLAILAQVEQERPIQFQVLQLLMQKAAAVRERIIIYLRERQVQPIVEMVERAQMDLIMEELAALV
jgi:hypothetical protein